MGRSLSYPTLARSLHEARASVHASRNCACGSSKGKVRQRKRKGRAWLWIQVATGVLARHGLLSRSEDVRPCILLSPVRELRTWRARCGSSTRPLLLLAHGVLSMHRFVGHVHGRCGWNVCLGLTTRTSSHPLALHTLSVLVARPSTIPRRGCMTPLSPFLCGTPSAPGSAGPSAWTFLSDPDRSLSNASDSPF